MLLLMAATIISVAAITTKTSRLVAGDDNIIIGNNAINGDERTLELVKAKDEVAFDIASAQAESGVGKNNFGWNVYETAAKHIAAGEYGNVLEFVQQDFEWVLRTDPCRAAAIICHYVHVVEPSNKILHDDTWKQPVGQQPNYVADKFIEDREYWQTSVDAFLEVLKDNAAMGVVELEEYTSSMYMYHDGRGAGLPDIVVRNSTNTGGHAFVLDFGKAGLIKLRLECGYQPIDVGYWEPPKDSTPEDDTPPTPPTPTPEPELEPKDPDAGPQGQVPNNPDYGGGKNDPGKTDKTETSEPTSPSTYTPPTAPTQEKPADTSQPSESFSDRHNNGGSETVGGKDYDVVTGTENKTIDEAQSSHSADTVEDPVKGDTNSGSLDAPE